MGQLPLGHMSFKRARRMPLESPAYGPKTARAEWQALRRAAKAAPASFGRRDAGARGAAVAVCEKATQLVGRDGLAERGRDERLHLPGHRGLIGDHDQARRRSEASRLVEQGP